MMTAAEVSQVADSAQQVQRLIERAAGEGKNEAHIPSGLLPSQVREVLCDWGFSFAPVPANATTGGAELVTWPDLRIGLDMRAQTPAKDAVPPYNYGVDQAPSRMAGSLAGRVR